MDAETLREYADFLRSKKREAEGLRDCEAGNAAWEALRLLKEYGDNLAIDLGIREEELFG